MVEKVSKPDKPDKQKKDMLKNAEKLLKDKKKNK
jgi:hypothetical protein